MRFLKQWWSDVKQRWRQIRDYHEGGMVEPPGPDDIITAPEEDDPWHVAGHSGPLTMREFDSLRARMRGDTPIDLNKEDIN